MELRFIEPGTRLDVQIGMKRHTNGVSYDTKFYELCDDLTFFTESEELYNALADSDAGAYVTVRFFRGSNIYSFIGKFKNATIWNKVRLVQIEQVSPLDVSTRRTFPRHEMSIPINIYVSESDDIAIFMRELVHSEAVYSGTTFDISAGGVCILANEPIAKSEGQTFFLELTLHKSPKFLLPAKIVRKGNSTQSVQFRFDYGFRFDYKNQEGEKSRLISAIFTHKNFRFTPPPTRGAKR